MQVAFTLAVLNVDRSVANSANNCSTLLRAAFACALGVPLPAVTIVAVYDVRQQLTLPYAATDPINAGNASCALLPSPSPLGRRRRLSEHASGPSEALAAANGDDAVATDGGGAGTAGPAAAAERGPDFNFRNRGEAARGFDKRARALQQPPQTGVELYLLVTVPVPPPGSFNGTLVEALRSAAVAVDSALLYLMGFSKGAVVPSTASISVLQPRLDAILGSYSDAVIALTGVPRASQAPYILSLPIIVAPGIPSGSAPPSPSFVNVNASTSLSPLPFGGGLNGGSSTPPPLGAVLGGAIGGFLGFLLCIGALEVAARMVRSREHRKQREALYTEFRHAKELTRFNNPTAALIGRRLGGRAPPSAVGFLGDADRRLNGLAGLTRGAAAAAAAAAPAPGSGGVSDPHDPAAAAAVAAAMSGIESGERKGVAASAANARQTPATPPPASRRSSGGRGGVGGISALDAATATPPPHGNDNDGAAVAAAVHLLHLQQFRSPEAHAHRHLPSLAPDTVRRKPTQTRQNGRSTAAAAASGSKKGGSGDGRAAATPTSGGGASANDATDSDSSTSSDSSAAAAGQTVSGQKKTKSYGSGGKANRRDAGLAQYSHSNPLRRTRGRKGAGKTPVGFGSASNEVLRNHGMLTGDIPFSTPTPTATEAALAAIDSLGGGGSDDDKGGASATADAHSDALHLHMNGAVANGVAKATGGAGMQHAPSHHAEQKTPMPTMTNGGAGSSSHSGVVPSRHPLQRRSHEDDDGAGLWAVA